MIAPEFERYSLSSARAKSTLFCWQCDHESPIGDDWRVLERAERLVYECPYCGTRVTARGPTETP